MDTNSKLPAEDKVTPSNMNKNVIIYFTIAMLIWWGGLQSISEQHGDHSVVVVALILAQVLLYKFSWPDHEFSWIGLLTGLIPILLAVIGLSNDNPLTLGVLLYFAAGTWIYWWWAKA